MQKKKNKNLWLGASLVLAVAVAIAVGRPANVRVQDQGLPERVRDEVFAPVPERYGWDQESLLEVQDTGVSLALPPGYRKDYRFPASAGLVARLEVDGEPSRSVWLVREQVGGGTCYRGYCDLAAEKTVEASGLKWGFLGSLQYCDAGECGEHRRFYRAERGGYAYYVSFVGETAEREVEILGAINFGGR